MSKEAEILFQTILDLHSTEIDPHWIRCYEKWSQHNGVVEPLNPFDRWLLEFSYHSTFQLKMADTYTALFCKNHPLREQLSAALAILECDKKAVLILDKGRNSQRIPVLFFLFWNIFGFIYTATVAIVWIRFSFLFCRKT